MDTDPAQLRKIENEIVVDQPYDDKLDGLLTEALGNCLREHKNDAMDKCESEFNVHIFPLLEARRLKTHEVAGYLKSCLASERQAAYCAQNGLKLGGGLKFDTQMSDSNKARQLLN